MKNLCNFTAGITMTTMTLIGQQFLPVPLCLSALECVCVCVCVCVDRLFSALTAFVGEKCTPPTVQFTFRCTINTEKIIKLHSLRYN